MRSTCSMVSGKGQWSRERCHPRGTSVADIHIQPPAAVEAIVARLESSGYETWYVGGAVRDALLGRADLDWDLATAAEPAVVRRLFKRTVPVGIEHGTVGVMGSDERLYEVTTFRADIETDGRHAVVRFGVSLDEDLARRDLTINAMAWSSTRRELRDPFGGRDDLEARVVRAVGDATQRMAEDRLRALRAIRFAGRFDFGIAPDTWGAIVESAPSLTRLSVERVLQEWVKTLEQVERPSQTFARWRESGALAVLVPPVVDTPAEFWIAIDHVARAGNTVHAGRASLRALVRLALPFLPLGARGAKRALTALRASNVEIAFTSDVAETWVTCADALQRLAIDGASDLSALRRIVAGIGRMRVGGTLRCVFAVWAARRALGLPAPDGAAQRRLARVMLGIAFRDPIALGDLAVTGDDLRAAGVAPGPAMGRILHEMLESVLADPTLNTHAALLTLVQQRTGES